MTSRPDPGNPPQTLCVQYVGVTAFDGSALSSPFERPLVAPNVENILEVEQNGELGLVDPDGGLGGSMGDRFIQWIEVVLDSPASLEISVVDGQAPSLVLTNPVPTQAVNDVFFRGTQFRVPQGGLMRIATTPPVGGRLRYRPTIEPQCCGGDSGGGGGDGGDGAYGSIGYGDEAVTQTGSAAGFVDILGPGVLDPAVDFSSSSANALTYDGTEAATFFIEAQANPNNGNAEESSYFFRLTVNDVPVASSLVGLIIGETHRVMACSRAQIELQPGDVVRAQIQAPLDGVDTTTTYFRLQAHQV